MICPTDPPQNNNKNQKNPEKNPSKGHPRARTLVEFKEKNSRSVFHNMQITSELLSSDPCARLKTQIPMHSISWGCPKIVCHSDQNSEQWASRQNKDKTERVTGLGRKTRKAIVKWNQTTALRCQTGGRHQTSPASLRGC